MTPVCIVDRGIRMLARFVRSEEKPVCVSCCYCMRSSEIPFNCSDHNRWVCPSCEQSNSFTSKDIDSTNGIMPCLGDIFHNNNRSMSYLKYAAPGKFTGQPSLSYQPELCDKCCKKQAEKIQKLNSFEPSSKVHFREEFENYKYYIERQYGLCLGCEKMLREHLNTQQKEMRTTMLDNHLHHSHRTPLQNRTASGRIVKVTTGILVLQVLSLLMLSFILYQESCSFPIEITSLSHPYFVRVKSLATRLRSFMIATFGEMSLKPLDKDEYVPVLFEMKIVLDGVYKVWKELMPILQPYATKIFRLRSIPFIVTTLLLQIVTFYKWRTRIGVMSLLLSSFLLATFTWEFLTHSLLMPWFRVIITILCWLLNLFTLIFTTLQYSGLYKKRKIRKNLNLYQNSLNPSSSMSSSSETCQSTVIEEAEENYEVDDITEEFLPGVLGKTLNAMSLGSSPLNHRRSSQGSYWSSSTPRTSTPNTNTQGAPPSPLVAMGQRPLIVPATLRLHSHNHANQRSSINCQQNDVNMDSADEDVAFAPPVPVSRSRRRRTTSHQMGFLVKLLIFLFIVSIFVNIVLLVLVVGLASKT